MRMIWSALLLLIIACDARVPWVDADPWQEDLNEQAVAAFITERSEPALPNSRLEWRAGSIYSTEPTPGPGGMWDWQVRYPRADAVRVPVNARDRLAGIELAVDVVVRFEHRYCVAEDRPAGGMRCQAWVAGACCNMVWRRARGGWQAAKP